MGSSQPPVAAIVGPTATGKSALALRLALHFDAEIVNADALQAVRRLDVGTGKPSLEDRGRVAHHLFDVVDASERFSAGEFSRRARLVIEEVRGRGRPVLLVGGSGLYLRSVLDGISPIPPADPEVRRELERRLLEQGLPALWRELEAVDPKTAARLLPGDRQRILRALEVARSSGRPLSEWIAAQPVGGERSSLAATRIGLTLPRTVLYDRIARRIDHMLAGGWVEEVRTLLAEGADPAAPAFQALGYRQLVAWLGGQVSWDLARQEIEQSTRRYAKRQMTWFRADPAVSWFDALDLDRLSDRVIDHLGARDWGRDR